MSHDSVDLFADAFPDPLPAHKGPAGPTGPPPLGSPPLGPPPSGPPPTVLTSVQGQPQPDATGEATEVRRFMTATDFLDRRADKADPGPATWGLRGFVR